MNATQITIGMGVFYTGNVCNESTRGTVEEVRDRIVAVRFACDGEVHWLPLSMFSTATVDTFRNCNEVFTYDSYRAARNELLATA